MYKIFSCLLCKMIKSSQTIRLFAYSLSYVSSIYPLSIPHNPFWVTVEMVPIPAIFRREAGERPLSYLVQGHFLLFFKTLHQNILNATIEKRWVIKWRTCLLSIWYAYESLRSTWFIHVQRETWINHVMYVHWIYTISTTPILPFLSVL